MSDLRDYISQFKPSRAVFIIKPDKRYSNLDFNLVQCDQMQEPNPGNDVIKLLAHTVVDQNWDPKNRRFTIDAKSMEEQTLNTLHTKLLQFLQNNMGNERPRQTKLYRWVDSARGGRFQRVFVELYKYIVPHCDSRMTCNVDGVGHQTNVILILQAMQEKYS